MSSSAQAMQNQIARADNLSRFYVYGLTFLAVAPGASSTLNIAIDAQSDFELRKMNQFSDIAQAGTVEGTRVMPNVTCVITEASNSLQMMSAPIAIPSLFGSGGLPFILPIPVLFKANSIITVTLTSFDAATTYNVRLAFIGIRRLHA
jgi:hypothetical protein